MIALYAIAGLVAVIILVWFVMTLNSIDRGIKNIGDALWKMAKKKCSKEEIRQEEKDIPEKQQETTPSKELTTREERSFLKVIEYCDKVRIYSVTKMKSEGDDKHRYKLVLKTSLKKPEPIIKFIDDGSFTKLDVDREYTREELGL